MTQAFTCRSCGTGGGELVLDLGVPPLANNLLRESDLAAAEPRFPLRLFVCPRCWLLQVTDLVPPVQMFTDYVYFSSFSDAMLRHHREGADRYRREYGLGRGSLVVEIASNDGYLLKNFVEAGVPCLGIEPAGNIAVAAREKGIETWTQFFDPVVAKEIARAKGQADLILANNVFAHVPDIHGFIEGLRIAMKPGGRTVIEFPYAVDMIAKTEFDTIYHEHAFYFTLTPLLPAFLEHQLELFDVERTAIHGGSLRIFVGHQGAHRTSERVARLFAEEQNAGVAGRAYYQTFASSVSGLKHSLRALLGSLKRQGQRVAAYGASAKGSTLLNYCDLGPETIDFVVDRSPHKHGRFTPGTHLPILPMEQLLARMPDVALLLVWNLADEVLDQQRRYRERGGRFLVPIPTPVLV